jgi:hypothetical protein
VGGLQDGIFSNQKSKLWDILAGLGMDNFGKFSGHLAYFRDIWYILGALGIF